MAAALNTEPPSLEGVSPSSISLQPSSMVRLGVLLKTHRVVPRYQNALRTVGFCSSEFEPLHIGRGWVRVDVLLVPFSCAKKMNITITHQPSSITHLPSYILHLFEHPPSPSPLKGLHLSLVFSPLMGKKTAPPVALTLR